MTTIVTLHTPWHPILRAAALERSMLLPLTKGPRSLILTTTDLPLCVTRTLVLKGNDLCAAVNALGLNRSPLAVRLLLLHCPEVAQSYQDAIVALAFVGIATNKNAAATRVSNDFISFSLFGGHSRTQTHNLRVRSAMLYSVELCDLLF